MKKILISVLAVIFIISMFSVVNAATGSVELATDTDAVLKGKTFTVTLNAVSDQNITGLQAVLSYDTSKLAIESKKAGENFTDASGNSEIAILASSTATTKTGTLYTITFKVLETAELGETQISVTNPVLALVNDNQEQSNYTASNTATTINIKEDNTTAGEEKPSNSNTNDNNTTTSGTSGNQKSSKLPQTGITDTGFVLITMISVISVISYISYKKYKNI